jgi:hypothetical protein
MDADRPADTPETDALPKTSVIRPGDRQASDPPAGVVICWDCSRAAELPSPSGWSVAPATGSYRFGIYPECLLARDLFVARYIEPD